MRLILVRHALPERVETVSEAPDPELSDTGRRQAAALAATLAEERIDAVWASPLRRAVQTAEPLAAARGLDVRRHDGLVEFDFGHGVYIPAEETAHPVVRQMRDRLDAQDGDEGLRRFRATVAAAMGDVVASGRPEDTIAVVCHGGVVNAYVAGVVGTRETIFAGIAYTGFSVLTVGRDGRVRLRSLNEHHHVRTLERVTSSG
ncbi:probable phosphoglycerate mutase [Jatrophihabitans endophyticus]|uniref:Probable phosphoglycerate mutase n=1 Tax=Jatrophihabitans endophyticus TaxID=1206085 RepID=A0A1M5UN69_9ACTN|nr:histidine phosphatase family protein [Jatrophihabitans endophyticus]SHH64434.1 probable phosphoglycerate mutase [Jatrophihabitans endophyticus]